ncbi:MAG TPA: MFS transporter [Thermoanaerobaculia bacterium]
MDSFIFALVLVPALRELLPKSGIPATPGTLGYYGSVLFALFLIGWGLALLWGPLADRFGRVRTMMIVILWYSLFTFLGAVSQRLWQLAVLRLLAGIGIGGEWGMGATFVAEEWPEERRKFGAALMHTGFYFGFFLAALANHVIGSRYGWRAMFAVGGLPALVVGFIRYGVHESARWEQKQAAVRQLSFWRPFAALFSPTYRRRTVLNSVFVLVSIAGLWAGSVYVPAAVTAIATRSGRTAAEAARLASVGGMLLAGGTILGCLATPWLAERIGRRGALAVFFALMFVFISVGFGYVFYMARALGWFMVCLCFLGMGGANFAVYTLWLPEQYSTECRASAFTFATSVGRFAGAGITFLVGMGVARYGSLGLPVALTSLAFVAGLALLPFGLETRGQALPE